MTTETRNIVRSVLFVVALALAGCGEKASQKQSPPKQQVQDAVRASLPPVLAFDSIELEPIPTGPETVKVNFKVTVTPKEDLYEVDREVEGTPRVTLLKVVQAAGTKVSFYGWVEARRTMDQWTLESPTVNVGQRQFGNPRGAFNAQSYATGSKEANAALKQQAANAAELERAKKVALEQRESERKAREEQQAREQVERQKREEQARIAQEEQRRKEMEQRKKNEEESQREDAAARQRIIQAFAPGTRYVGTIAWRDRVQRIVLVFTEQRDSLIRAEASNPEQPKVRQTFTGQLVFKPQERPLVPYPIVLSPVGKQEFPEKAFGEVWGFYKYNFGSLKLLLTDTDLDGEADIWSSYTIHLKREQRPLATPPADPRRRPDGILPLTPPGPPASPPAPSAPAKPPAPSAPAPRSP